MSQPIHATITLENLVLETTVSRTSREFQLYGSDAPRMTRISREFQMQVSNTDFVSTNLYEWEPANESEKPIPPIELEEYITEYSSQKYLRNLRLEFRIPQILQMQQREIPATLTLIFFHKSTWFIKLEFENQEVSRQMTVIDYEDDYRLLEKQYGRSLSLKNCFGCAYSDYSEYGRDFIGSMGCFRNTKEEYLQTRYKLGTFWENMVEQVNKLYLCDEFEPRNPNIRVGYRG
jgi:hypothetical protein